MPTHSNPPSSNTGTSWFSILVILSALIAITHIYTQFTYQPVTGVEGFDNDTQKFVMKTNVNLYDDFYATIYDELVYTPIKTEFEVGQIVSSTKPTRESIILDIGCGTGHAVGEFMYRGFKNTIGIDSSKQMIQTASANYPSGKFYVSDIMDMVGFPLLPSTYTHIACLYFTAYYMSDKTKFLKNCYKLLKPGGYMGIHLVDRNQFDPILPPGNPFYILSPQNYAKKRITQTKLNFNGFDYNANFSLNKTDNVATFEETFKDTSTNNVRMHKHSLFMEPLTDILQIIKNVGFIIHAKIDMLQCSYDYQYIYILYKPA